MRYLLVFGVVAILMAATPAIAVPISHIESVDGLFSQSSAAPTNVGTFDVGNNRIEGGLNDGTGPNDVFTFTIGVDQALTGIVLDEYTPGAFNRMFFAIHNAPTFPVDEFTLLFDSGTLIGNEFMGGLLVGDLLDANLLFDPNPAVNTISSNLFGIGTGFSAPVGPGQYTVYMQQTGGAATQYEFDFQVSSTLAAVPEPSSLAFMLGSCAIVGLRRRRKKPSPAADTAHL